VSIVVEGEGFDGLGFAHIETIATVAQCLWNIQGYETAFGTS